MFGFTYPLKMFYVLLLGIFVGILVYPLAELLLCFLTVKKRRRTVYDRVQVLPTYLQGAVLKHGLSPCNNLSWFNALLQRYFVELSGSYAYKDRLIKTMLHKTSRLKQYVSVDVYKIDVGTECPFFKTVRIVSQSSVDFLVKHRKCKLVPCDAETSNFYNGKEAQRVSLINHHPLDLKALDDINLGADLTFDYLFLLFEVEYYGKMNVCTRFELPGKKHFDVDFSLHKIEGPMLLRLPSLNTNTKLEFSFVWLNELSYTVISAFDQSYMKKAMSGLMKKFVMHSLNSTLVFPHFMPQILPNVTTTARVINYQYITKSGFKDFKTLEHEINMLMTMEYVFVKTQRRIIMRKSRHYILGTKTRVTQFSMDIRNVMKKFDSRSDIPQIKPAILVPDNETDKNKCMVVATSSNSSIRLQREFDAPLPEFTKFKPSNFDFDNMPVKTSKNHEESADSHAGNLLCSSASKNSQTKAKNVKLRHAQTNYADDEIHDSEQDDEKFYDISVKKPKDPHDSNLDSKSTNKKSKDTDSGYSSGLDQNLSVRRRNSIRIDYSSTNTPSPHQKECKSDFTSNNQFYENNPDLDQTCPLRFKNPDQTTHSNEELDKSGAYGSISGYSGMQAQSCCPSLFNSNKNNPQTQKSSRHLYGESKMTKNNLKANDIFCGSNTSIRMRNSNVTSNSLSKMIHPKKKGFFNKVKRFVNGSLAKMKPKRKSSKFTNKLDHEDDPKDYKIPNYDSCLQRKTLDPSCENLDMQKIFKFYRLYQNSGSMNQMRAESDDDQDVNKKNVEYQDVFKNEFGNINKSVPFDTLCRLNPLEGMRRERYVDDMLILAFFRIFIFDLGIFRGALEHEVFTEIVSENDGFAEIKVVYKDSCKIYHRIVSEGAVIFQLSDSNEFIAFKILHLQFLQIFVVSDFLKIDLDAANKMHTIISEKNYEKLGSYFDIRYDAGMNSKVCLNIGSMDTVQDPYTFINDLLDQWPQKKYSQEFSQKTIVLNIKINTLVLYLITEHNARHTAMFGFCRTTTLLNKKITKETIRLSSSSQKSYSKDPRGADLTFRTNLDVEGALDTNFERCGFCGLQKYTCANDVSSNISSVEGFDNEYEYIRSNPEKTCSCEKSESNLFDQFYESNITVQAKFNTAICKLKRYSCDASLPIDHDQAFEKIDGDMETFNLQTALESTNLANTNKQTFHRQSKNYMQKNLEHHADNKMSFRTNSNYNPEDDSLFMETSTLSCQRNTSDIYIREQEKHMSKSIPISRENDGFIIVELFDLNKLLVFDMKQKTDETSELSLHYSNPNIVASFTHFVTYIKHFERVVAYKQSMINLESQSYNASEIKKEIPIENCSVYVEITNKGQNPLILTIKNKSLGTYVLKDLITGYNNHKNSFIFGVPQKGIYKFKITSKKKVVECILTININKNATFINDYMFDCCLKTKKKTIMHRNFDFVKNQNIFWNIKADHVRGYVVMKGHRESIRHVGSMLCLDDDLELCLNNHGPSKEIISSYIYIGQWVS